MCSLTFNETGIVSGVYVGVQVARCKMIDSNGEVLVESVFACGEGDFPSFRFLQYGASDPDLKTKTSTSRRADLFSDLEEERPRRASTHARRG